MRDQVGSASLDPERPEDLNALLVRVASRDVDAFGSLCDAVAASVFGLIRRVVRDRVRSEATFEAVMLEIWRTAGRFDPDRGRAVTWILAITYRRAAGQARPLPEVGERDRLVVGSQAVPPLSEQVAAPVRGLQPSE